MLKLFFILYFVISLVIMQQCKGSNPSDNVIVAPPIYVCPDGQRKDKNGKCRIVLVKVHSA